MKPTRLAWLTFAGAFIAASTSLGAATMTLKGTVSDAMCGAKHMMAGNDAECTRTCVKKGSKYTLIVGDKVYTLDGHEAELDKLAG